MCLSLFKIYLLDILQEFEKHDRVQLYKFADDGTVKVKGETMEECMTTLHTVLE